MDNQEKKAYVTLAAIIGVPIVLGALEYAKVAREERAKRKKIQEWKQMNLEALVASQNRLVRIAKDPTATSADMMHAWNEECKFLKLINDQPMY